MASIIHQDQTVTEDVALTIKEMQRVIEGPVALRSLPFMPDFLLVVHKKGLLLGLEPNDTASKLAQQYP